MPVTRMMSQRVIVTLGTCTALLLLAGTAAARDIESAKPEAQSLAVSASSSSSPPPSDEEPFSISSSLLLPAATPWTTSPATAGNAAPTTTLASLPVLPRTLKSSDTTTPGRVVTTAGPPPTMPLAAPAPPGPIDWPPRAVVEGPGSWSITAEGIAATLRISPTSPRVGDVVHLSMTATYGRLGCCIAVLYPGDGTLVKALNETHHPCFETPAGEFTLELDHVYNEPGPVEIQFQPTIIVCQLPQPLPAGFRGMISTNLFASVDIRPAA